MADVASLRARWPDVLEAVQSRKRVAWIQLSNASVSAFDDGMLTLAFANAGTAKGFVVGENDKVLGDVIADLFGVTPRITTSVGTSGARQGAAPAAGQAPPASSDPAPAPPIAEDGARRPRAGTGPANSGRANQPGQAARRSGPDRPSAGLKLKPGPSPDHGAELDDQPAHDSLTGSDLIARELGGRIIEELDGL